MHRRSLTQVKTSANGERDGGRCDGHGVATIAVSVASLMILTKTNNYGELAGRFGDAKIIARPLDPGRLPALD